MLWGERMRRLGALAGLAALVSACDAASVVRSEDVRRPVDDGAYVELTDRTFAAVTTQAVFRARTAQLSMTVVDPTTSDDMRMSMAVDYGGAEGDMAMSGTITDQHGSSEMRLVDGKAYLREEDESVFYQLPDHLTEEMLGEMGLGGPMGIIGKFADGIESVRFTTSHEVSYGETYRYELVMREAYMAEEFGVPASAIPEFEFVLWLDQDHLIRRMDVTVMGARGSVTMTDWGEPVTIEAPPADEVEPLPMPDDVA